MYTDAARRVAGLGGALRHGALPRAAAAGGPRARAQRLPARLPGAAAPAAVQRQVVRQLREVS